jgi:acyl dehydratase
MRMISVILVINLHNKKFMPKKITKIDLQALVGQEIGLSDWFEINQERIDKFAEVTEDYQYIHTDPIRAKTSPFGSTIAHGLLTLSMIIHLCEDFKPEIDGLQMVVNYGFDKIRFQSAVKVNERIRARAVLMKAREIRESVLVTARIKIEIENVKKPALVADWLTMHVII